MDNKIKSLNIQSSESIARLNNLDALCQIQKQYLIPSVISYTHREVSQCIQKPIDLNQPKQTWANLKNYIKNKNQNKK